MTGLGLLVALAGPAAAEVLTPEAFEALAEGRTLYFTQGEARYGEEQYLPGRRSLWRYEDGSCSNGLWWGEGEAICFSYEDAPGPQCWRFTRGPRGVSAELVEGGARTGIVVEMSRADTVPLPCAGPDVGT
jgi:hypothetical protein